MSVFRRSCLLVTAVALAWAAIPAARAQARLSGAAKNFQLARFDPASGFKTLELRGAEGFVLGPERVDINGFLLVKLDGRAEARVLYRIEAPSATFWLKENRATGREEVHLVSDTYELRGEEWAYDHGQATFSLRRKVRATFKIPMQDLLR